LINAADVVSAVLTTNPVSSTFSGGIVTLLASVLLSMFMPFIERPIDSFAHSPKR
jgi:hypothetical protein